MIGIVGSGNLAWHLAGVLPGRSTVLFRAVDDMGRWPVPLLPLTAVANREWEALILAVPDAAISEVSSALASVIDLATPVIHTSGATPHGRTSDAFRNRGVCWPIRSLRKGEKVGDWRDLPLVLQADAPRSRDYLTSLASGLSERVAWLDDRQRAQLHLAAVFSNNFVTALYDVAFQLCEDEGVPFELLLPIIRHTAGSQDGTRPALRQTGAAARGDRVTMDRHLGLLSTPAYRHLYRSISDLILQYRLTEHDPDLGGEADNDLKNKRIV